MTSKAPVRSRTSQKRKVYYIRKPLGMVYSCVLPNLKTMLNEAISLLLQFVTQFLKPVFHFNRIVTYRSIFFCVEVISSTLVVRKQRNTLRFATIRLKWKTGFTQSHIMQAEMHSHKTTVSMYGRYFTLKCLPGVLNFTSYFMIA